MYIKYSIQTADLTLFFSLHFIIIIITILMITAEIKMPVADVLKC